MNAGIAIQVAPADARRRKAGVEAARAKLSPFPSLDDLRSWCTSMAALRDRSTFMPSDECDCPVAKFLSARAGVALEVGNDDVVFEGWFVVELPQDWKDFVRRVDLRWREPFTVTQLLQQTFWRCAP